MAGLSDSAESAWVFRYTALSDEVVVQGQSAEGTRWLKLSPPSWRFVCVRVRCVRCSAVQMVVRRARILGPVGKWLLGGSEDGCARKGGAAVALGALVAFRGAVGR
eukprot:12867561-Alexandrium_andersonii.AAC.1